MYFREYATTLSPIGKFLNGSLLTRYAASCAVQAALSDDITASGGQFCMALLFFDLIAGHAL